MKKKLISTLALFLAISFFSIFVLINKATAQAPLPTPIPVNCGTIYIDEFLLNGTPKTIHYCNCEEYTLIDNPTQLTVRFCCGWWHGSTCHATEPTGPIYNSPTPGIPIPTSMIPIPNENLLNSLNPLKLFSSKADQLSDPGGIISEILKFAFPLAGTILFVMLIMAGLKMLVGASNSKNMDEGKQMIGTAIAGFIILFASYWIIQLIERIFGIRILGVW